MKHGLIINNVGVKYWYENDQLHRVGGPAVESINGSTYWYQNNRLHRIEGPAIEHVDGIKQWFENGERHRISGPAYESSKIKEWYFKGKYIKCSTQKEFERLIKLSNFW